MNIFYLKIFLKNNYLFIITFVSSLLISLSLTPIFRKFAQRYKIFDHPYTDIKTHKSPVPYLGGIPIWIGWVMSLFIIRIFTDFPTGTLHNLRGIIFGSFIILILGLIDDLLPLGLNFKNKFLIQIVAALILIFFDIRLHFIRPYFIAFILSMIWIVGITNAFNIVDIMDGLSSGLAIISSLAFIFISLPTEQIYVNFCAAALAGACLGFLPFNLSKNKKIFMGDTGSLTIGFILAAISLGTSYTTTNDIGVMAPILILAIPIYDTILVTFIRIKKGQSPFLGSKDHFALRLETMGLSRPKILIITYLASAILSFGAFIITRLEILWAMIVFFLFLIIAIIISYRLGEVEVD